METVAAARPEETAAITAAIEHFLDESAPPPQGRPPDRWRLAGILEGVGGAPGDVWGFPDPWARGGAD